MTGAFDHPPDATCDCIVCRYQRVEEPPAVANDVPDEPPTPRVIARLRARAGRESATLAIAPYGLTREEKALATTLVAPPDAPPRPRTRGECIDGPRPCPWVGCKWHLYLDVTAVGSLKLNHVSREPWELEETCALDVADRGGETLERVGQLVGLTRERVRQIELEAGQRVGRRHPWAKDAA